MTRRKNKLIQIMLILFLSASFSAAGAAFGKDISTATPHVTVTTTATPTQTKTPAVKTAGVKKDFKWFFKNGCNCPQCRAFKDQQEDIRERRQNLFQP